MIYKVELSKHAKKNLKKVPWHVARKLMDWLEDVEDRGLEVVRQISGYHDEPLQGLRFGQRSIRLSRSYRAFYRIVRTDVEWVLIEEVSKHDY